MFKKIPGSNTYSASLDGRIRNDDTGCEPVIINKRFTIELYGKSYTVLPQWLGLLAHYEINLPDVYQNALALIKFGEINKKVTSSICDFIPVFHKPLEIQGYRIIPGFSEYMINKEGTVIETFTQRRVYPQRASANGYPYIFIHNPDKSRKMEIMVHRLVALAWLPNNDYVYKCVVNHKNGDKHNYHVDNLEWCSYSENQLHACKTGLATYTVECKVRDIHTGVVTIYNSLADFFRAISVINKAPRRTLFESSKRGYFFQGRYEVKELADLTEWVSLKYNTAINNQYMIRVTDKDKNVLYSIRDIRTKFGIWNVSNIGNILTKARSLYPELTFDLEQLKPVSVPIEGFNIKTKVLIEEPSIKAFNRITGVNESTLRKIVSTKRPRLIGDLIIRVKSDEPWNNDVFLPPSLPKRILATNIATCNTKTFNSLREAAKFYEVDRQTIKLRISQNRELKGWILTYAT